MTLQEEIQRRRTFAIISHPDAGKTTLTEKFLLYGGAIAQAGVVKGKKNSRAAVSDWMEIEKQRGISVTSSVLQFSYNGYCINILDTPGHQDFSEDTYRTLMAADSAVMVIDAAKGVEPQTRKLFKVCTLRHIPIFTFINKMDRDARDPFELCEQIEQELGIETCPINWPIGSGKEFQGVYDRPSGHILRFTDTSFKSRSAAEEIELSDPKMGELIGEDKWHQLQEEVDLLGAGAEFDLERVRSGQQSPVFFGSALTTFGVLLMAAGGVQVVGQTVHPVKPINTAGDNRENNGQRDAPTGDGRTIAAGIAGITRSIVGARRLGRLRCISKDQGFSADRAEFCAIVYFCAAFFTFHNSPLLVSMLHSHGGSGLVPPGIFAEGLL